MNPYSGNRGVGALTYSVLYLLNNIEKEYKIVFEYYVMGTAENRTDKDIIKIDGHTAVPIENVRCIIALGIKEKLKILFHIKEYRKYSQFDYILDIGEGDSYTDMYGIERFMALNFTKKKFIKEGMKQMLLPQTIGPFNNLKVKKMAKITLEACNVILVRDKQSFDYLKKETNQKNIVEIIDVAFFMPYEKEEFSHNHINVGLNVSALLWNGGYTRNNQFGLKSDYHKLIHDVIDYFLSFSTVKLHLVPHVVESGYTVENDYAISYQLLSENKNDRLILSPFFLDPIKAKNYISGLDFFVGSRMHTCIAAFSSGVPVYPIAYSRKFNGLFIDTLDYKYMGDMLKQGTDEILNDIQEAFNKKEELKEIIQNRMNTTVIERGKLLKQQLVDFLELN